nr:hydantoinase/oxoprolinase family protein [Sporomusa acidovorans]OZC22137.1 acetophenone carboxylase gamma subunit [Sporomusa acidovorans DSM 3132]
MRIVLGIDTGGTYTDGVIVELGTGVILKKAKARTTRTDLAIGIKNCIENLAYDNYEEISMVALSTTLATNAVVEGKGSEVGVIIIGNQLIEKLPGGHCVVINGGHDTGGMAYEQLDEETLVQAFKGFRNKVSAIAISGFCSVRNPEHELRAKELAQMHLNLPVVCAHQLATSLGFYQRTVTAYLNAKLLPIITEWIDLIKMVLGSFGINAQIMIVKSDGSLTDIKAAMEKPIETILTGPAASIVGACNLSGKNDAIIFDMGGTTTDIAMIKRGTPKITEEGAVVGGWRTRVRAADIYTYGLGGDSYIKVDLKKTTIGPERVLPLCYAAQEYPNLLEELNSNKLMAEASSIPKADCLMIVKDIDEVQMGQLAPEERGLLNIIKDKPHSLYHISKELNFEPYYLNNYIVNRLVKAGIITRISLTPTDILHVLNECTLWSCEAAERGVALLASQLLENRDEFIKRVVELITRDIAIALVQSLIGMQGYEFDIHKNLNNIFVKKIFEQHVDDYFNCRINIPAPLVAVGAPVKAWLPKVGKLINIDINIPEHAEVANAYGAVTARIVERIDVVIKPARHRKGLGVHLPWEYKAFDDLEKAVSYATDSAVAWAKDRLIKAGAANLEVKVERKDIIAATNDGFDIFVETLVKVVAVGDPRFV